MKKLAIVLAIAIAFDLGTVVASSHAAHSHATLNTPTPATINTPTPINMKATRASMGGSSLAAPGGKVPAKTTPTNGASNSNQHAITDQANAGIQSSYLRTICKTGETSATREGKTTCIPSSTTSHETGDMPR